MERMIGTYIFDPEMTEGKMLFVTGPRQVGKTTFARDWLESLKFSEGYFNWDDPSVMAAYNRNPLHFQNFIDETYREKRIPLVFDEIHKHKDWRNILKGLFDTNKERMRLLVTGSARLDYARKSGDSLIGRYFSYHMYPLGLVEVTGDFTHVLEETDSLNNLRDFTIRARNAVTTGSTEGLELLLKFGGFPEPLLKGSVRFHRRWQTEYKTLLTREDVRDLSRISDIRGLETMVEILPAKVGSNLSIPSLSRDLGRKYDTIRNWLHILEGLYLVFTIRPWHKSIARAIKKEKKLYFFDWSLIPDTGGRFENLVAAALLRMASRLTETGMGSHEVRYVRDREKREVDFLLVKDDTPLALFEAKVSDTAISRSGRFFARKLGVPLFQIVAKTPRVEVFPENCCVLPASNFLLLTG